MDSDISSSKTVSPRKIITYSLLFAIFAVGFFVIKNNTFKASVNGNNPSITPLVYSWPNDSDFNTFTKIDGTISDGKTISLAGESNINYSHDLVLPDMPNLSGSSGGSNGLLTQIKDFVLTDDGKNTYAVSLDQSNNSTMVKFDTNSGSEVWESLPSSDRSQTGSSIALGGDGRLYTIDGSSIIRVWNADTGAHKELEIIDTNSWNSSNSDLYAMKKIYYDKNLNKYYILGYKFIHVFSNSISKSNDQTLDNMYTDPLTGKSREVIDIPEDITIDKNGNIFVLNSNKTIVIYKNGATKPEKPVTIKLSSKDIDINKTPVLSIAADGDNKLLHLGGEGYLANYNYGSVSGLSGGTFQSWYKPGNSQGEISVPYSMTWKNNKLYVGDGDFGRPIKSIKPFVYNIGKTINYLKTGTAILEGFNFKEGKVEIKDVLIDSTVESGQSVKVEFSVDNSKWFDETTIKGIDIDNNFFVRVSLATIDTSKTPVLNKITLTYKVPTVSTKPEKPKLLTPTTGSIASLQPTLTLKDDFKDVDGGAWLKTYWQLSEDSAFVNFVEDISTTSKTSYVVTKTLTDGKIYYWRAAYIDSDGDSRDSDKTTLVWSDSGSFVAKRVVTSPPEKPKILSPVDKSIILDLKPKLEASNFVSISGTAFDYSEWQICTMPACTTYVAGIVSTKVPSTNYTPNIDLSLNKAYYWRVKYVDKNGLSSPWSDVSSFMIKNPGKIVSKVPQVKTIESKVVNNTFNSLPKTITNILKSRLSALPTDLTAKVNTCLNPASLPAQDIAIVNGCLNTLPRSVSTIVDTFLTTLQNSIVGASTNDLNTLLGIVNNGISALPSSIVSETQTCLAPVSTSTLTVVNNCLTTLPTSLSGIIKNNISNLPQDVAKLVVNGNGAVVPSTLQLRASVVDVGSSPIIESGFVIKDPKSLWGTYQRSYGPEVFGSRVNAVVPDIALKKNQNLRAGNTFVMIDNMSSLRPGEKYYIQSFASNAEGTGYGNETSFVVPKTPAVVTYINDQFFLDKINENLAPLINSGLPPGFDANDIKLKNAIPDALSQMANTPITLSPNQIIGLKNPATRPMVVRQIGLQMLQNGWKPLAAYTTGQVVQSLSGIHEDMTEDDWRKVPNNFVDMYKLYQLYQKYNGNRDYTVKGPQYDFSFRDFSVSMRGSSYRLRVRPSLDVSYSLFSKPGQDHINWKAEVGYDYSVDDITVKYLGATYGPYSFTVTNNLNTYNLMYQQAL